jgi:hypothetical protein
VGEQRLAAESGRLRRQATLAEGRLRTLHGLGGASA